MKELTIRIYDFDGTRRAVQVVDKQGVNVRGYSAELEKVNGNVFVDMCKALEGAHVVKVELVKEQPRTLTPVYGFEAWCDTWGSEGGMFRVNAHTAGQAQDFLENELCDVLGAANVPKVEWRKMPGLYISPSFKRFTACRNRPELKVGARVLCAPNAVQHRGTIVGATSSACYLVLTDPQPGADRGIRLIVHPADIQLEPKAQGFAVQGDEPLDVQGVCDYLEGVNLPGGAAQINNGMLYTRHPQATTWHFCGYVADVENAGKVISDFFRASGASHN